MAPGLVGGRYLPLSDRDLARIHEAALEVLERVGMADATPALRELAQARGAPQAPRGCGLGSGLGLRLTSATFVVAKSDFVPCP